MLLKRPSKITGLDRHMLPGIPDKADICPMSLCNAQKRVPRTIGKQTPFIYGNYCVFERDYPVVRTQQKSLYGVHYGAAYFLG